MLPLLLLRQRTGFDEGNLIFMLCCECLRVCECRICFMHDYDINFLQDKENMSLLSSGANHESAVDD